MWRSNVRPTPGRRRSWPTSPKPDRHRTPTSTAPTQDGSGLYQVTQKRGRRWSTAVGFLRPALGRPNLTVRTNALTTRVLVEDGRAVAVEYRHDGATTRADVDGEVILSGGAINSPQLLMLSGIGPAAHLREVGIDVVHDLPGVGQGLQDHPAMPLIATARGSSLKDAESPRQVADYYLRRRGMLTSNVGEGGSFFRSRADLDIVDLQFHFAPVKFYAQAMYDPDEHALTLAATLVRVASRGAVTLRSADPTWAPAIDAGYLTEDGRPRSARRWTEGRSRGHQRHRVEQGGHRRVVARRSRPDR